MEKNNKMWTTDKMLPHSLAQSLKSYSVYTLERDRRQNLSWERNSVKICIYDVYTWWISDPRPMIHEPLWLDNLEADNSMTAN